MIFRITDYVHYGTLDNRERGTVRLTLQPSSQDCHILPHVWL